MSATHRFSGGCVGGLPFYRHRIVGCHISSVHGHHPQIKGVLTERLSSKRLLPRWSFNANFLAMFFADTGDTDGRESLFDDAYSPGAGGS